MERGQSLSLSFTQKGLLLFTEKKMIYIQNTTERQELRVVKVGDYNVEELELLLKNTFTEETYSYTCPVTTTPLYITLSLQSEGTLTTGSYEYELRYGEKVIDEGCAEVIEEEK